MLEYYIQHFDTLELNNSFYRLPAINAFEGWRDSTPRDFIFAVKASRFITHNKKLKDPENAIDNILPRAEHLGKKLGPMLFQLPPRWKVNAERLENLLAILPRKHRYAFEFRETSWMSPEINRILKKFNAAFCIYELAGYHSPLEVTADFAYVRLHGPADGKYQGSYSKARLTKWVRQMGFSAPVGLATRCRPQCAHADEDVAVITNPADWFSSVFLCVLCGLFFLVTAF